MDNKNSKPPIKKFNNFMNDQNKDQSSNSDDLNFEYDEEVK